MLLGVACTTSKNNATVATSTPTTQSSEVKQTDLKPMQTTDNRLLPTKAAIQQAKVSAPKQGIEQAPSKN